MGYYSDHIYASDQRVNNYPHSNVSVQPKLFNAPIQTHILGIFKQVTISIFNMIVKSFTNTKHEYTCLTIGQVVRKKTECNLYAKWSISWQQSLLCHSYAQ